MIPIPFSLVRGVRWSDPEVAAGFAMLGGAIIALGGLFFLSYVVYGAVPVVLGGAIVGLAASVRSFRSRRRELSVAVVLLAVASAFVGFGIFGWIGSGLAILGGLLLLGTFGTPSGFPGARESTFRTEDLGPPCPRCGRHIPTWTSQCPYCGGPPE